MTGALTLDRRTAKRLGLPTQIGTGRAALDRGGKVRLVLKLSAKARRTLGRHPRALLLGLSILVKDRAGNPRRLVGAVTIRL